MYSLNKEEWIESLKNNDSSTKSSLLYKKISSDLLTPISAFLKLKKYFKDHIFLFESADNYQKKGRFSII